MAFSAEDAVLLKQMTDPLLISQITAEMAIYNSASGDFRLFETAEILSLRFDEPCHCVTISTFLSNSISLSMKENCYI